MQNNISKAVKYIIIIFLIIFPLCGSDAAETVSLKEQAESESPIKYPLHRDGLSLRAGDRVQITLNNLFEEDLQCVLFAYDTNNALEIPLHLSSNQWLGSIEVPFDGIYDIKVYYKNEDITNESQMTCRIREKFSI